MINVAGRALVIPLPERLIGTTYDHQAEIRRFCLGRYQPGGIDLSHLEFRIDLKYSGDVYDTCILEKEISEERILLSWLIAETSVKRKGTVWASLRGMDREGTIRWGSSVGAFYIEDNVDAPEHMEHLTELEQMEALVRKALEKADQTSEEYRALVERTIQEITSKNNEVRQEARENLELSKAANEKAESAVAKAELAMTEAEQAVADARTTLEQANDKVAEAEAWAHGRSDYPAMSTENSKYWSNRAKDYMEKAQNEADRAQAYADFVEPEFLISDNRIYMKKDSTVEFLVNDNRMYLKLPV